VSLHSEAGETCHQSSEKDDGLQKISDEEPRAFTGQTECPEPVQADDCSDNEDDPISVGRTRNVNRRLHDEHRHLFGFLFPDVSLAG